MQHALRIWTRVICPRDLQEREALQHDLPDPHMHPHPHPQLQHHHSSPLVAESTVPLANPYSAGQSDRIPRPEGHTQARV